MEKRNTGKEHGQGRGQKCGGEEERGGGEGDSEAGKKRKERRKVKEK